ncbi:hypothetical protein DDZ18_11735 [Marinicauda salina]|uniref:BLUF domain-containing protein n=1 Tax=Marinicauda salina TaxID=2135793 RepID=A0A2U2BS71_9PROT|nr:BLUF domain-containing protein [Marinicauda salina]PWE16854.1 hypothetical protein DDZ18_11735 [Marinicauda salina]
MFLTRMIYHSAPRFETDSLALEQALAEIMAAGLRNNPAAGISGVLAVDGQRFIQVMEGPRDRLSETFARIGSDTRHRDLVIAFFGEVDSRVFPDWSVAMMNPITLPECEPRCVDYDAITAEGLLERARRIRETGAIAGRETRSDGESAA